MRRLQRNGASDQLVLKTGQQYRLHGLRNRVELNGALVTLLYLPDDSGRCTAVKGGSLLRMHADRLAHPAEP